jgi:hypothetical protein
MLIQTSFASNREGKDSLAEEFIPHLATLPHLSSTSSQGDGIRMARQIGARLIHMENVKDIACQNVRLITKYIV